MSRLRIFEFFLLAILAASFACKKLRSPVVETREVTNVTAHSAFITGNVSTAGFGRLTHVGICWNKSPSPTIDNNKSESQRLIGEFTGVLNVLDNNTTYYARAFAQNKSGTSYGKEVSFTTSIDWQKKASVSPTSQCILLHNNAMYVGGYDGLFVSHDNGLNWSWSGNGLPKYSSSSAGDERYYLVKCLTTVAGLMIAGTDGGGVFKSSDNGNSWTLAGQGLYNLNVTALAVNDSTIFAGTRGGLYKLPLNGTSWTYLDLGFSSQVISSVVVTKKNILISTDANTVFIRSLAGGGWESVNVGISNYFVSLFAFGTDIFCSTSSGLLKSTNEGSSWEVINNTLSNSRTMVKISASYFLNNFAGTFQSDDEGKTWKMIGSGMFLICGDNAKLYGLLGGNIYELPI